jgi:anthranilate synthase component 2
MILILDNYDSFTYNLYQYAGIINPDIKVVRNDRITVEGIKELNPTHIIISPGPGYPKDAGIAIELIKQLGCEIPILGICLGHQAIGEAFGGRVILSPQGPVHGKKSEVEIDTNCPLFSVVPKSISVARYHSLVVERDTLPAELNIISQTADGTIMGLAHKQYPIYGIQFHPESILTSYGMEIICNFLVKVK